MMIFGVLGIIGSIVLFVMKKENKLVKYHFKQWLILFITEMVLGLILVALIFATLFVPALFMLGETFSKILSFAILLGDLTVFLLLMGCFVLWIFGIVYAFIGRQKPLPIIGKLGEKFNF